MLRRFFVFSNYLAVGIHMSKESNDARATNPPTYLCIFIIYVVMCEDCLVFIIDPLPGRPLKISVQSCFPLSTV